MTNFTTLYIHEAGHAAVAQALNCKVGYIESANYTARAFINFRPVSNINNAVISLAGYYAELLILKRVEGPFESSKAYKGDYKNVLALNLTEEELEIAHSSAKYLVETERKYILAIAKRVMKEEPFYSYAGKERYFGFTNKDWEYDNYLNN